MFNINDKLVMIDIETDGLDACNNHMTSVCMQEFDFEHGVSRYATHFRIAALITDRYGDSATIQWRTENAVNEFEMNLPAFHPHEGLQFLKEYCRVDEQQQLHLFANHPEFDIAFLKSYCSDNSMEPFWKYSNIWDLGSLIRGMRVNRQEIKEGLKASAQWQFLLDEYFNGKEQPHNAFYDCVYQIETLRWADMVHLKF